MLMDMNLMMLAKIKLTTLMTLLTRRKMINQKKQIKSWKICIKCNKEEKVNKK